MQNWNFVPPSQIHPFSKPTHLATNQPDKPRLVAIASPYFIKNLSSALVSPFFQKRGYLHTEKAMNDVAEAEMPGEPAKDDGAPPTPGDFAVGDARQHIASLRRLTGGSSSGNVSFSPFLPPMFSSAVMSVCRVGC
jgi:hypothetical protein